MHIFLRLVSVCALVCSLAVFALVGYAQLALPDEYSIMSGDSVELDAPYTLAFEDTTADGVCVSGEYAGASKREYAAQINLLGVIPVKSARVTSAKRYYAVPLGTAFGIKLYTQGVIVVKTDEVTTKSGSVNPAQEAGIRIGDVITHIDSRKVERNEDVSNAFAKSEGSEIELTIVRDGKNLKVITRAALSAIDGKYRVGIWVRDSSAGIGTLTFYDEETNCFAGLGHAVCDVDTGAMMPLAGGEALSAQIKGSYRGESGSPGELCGVFGEKVIGKLILNTDTGVYGVAVNPDFQNKALPVAMSYEVETGAAQIISEINENGAKYFDVAITKIYQNTDSHQKNMIIRVTDEELIKETGGIVQGMSGSPIIQNGMLVGAVTHVFINNPLQGYAIFAQTMTQTQRDYGENQQKMAS